MAEIDGKGIEPNSHKYKEEKKEKERLKPIVKDGVVSTKKSALKKMTEKFIEDDAKDIKDYILLDIVVPGIKNTILDIIQMAFFGEVSRDRRNRYDSDRRRRDSSRVSYSSYYRGSSYDSSRRRDRRYDSDDSVDYKNIVLRERRDAEDVISKMRERIEEYGSASIADLFDLIDVTSSYTDNNWGWTDDRDIGIRRVTDGYLIDVAEAKCLK